MPGKKSKKTHAKARKNSSKPSSITDSSSVKQHPPADPLAAEFCKIFEDLQNNNKTSTLEHNVKKTDIDIVPLVKKVVKEVQKDVITRLENCEKINKVVVDIGSNEDTGKEKEVVTKETERPGVKQDSLGEGQDCNEKENQMEEVMKETIKVNINVVDSSDYGISDTRDKGVTRVKQNDCEDEVKVKKTESEQGVKDGALLEESKAGVKIDGEEIQKTEEEVSAQKCQDHISQVIEAGCLKKRRICRVVKHPLAHSWTFWHLNPDKRLSWTEKQKKILSVSTVEDFWAVYNWILQPSKLKASSDYSLFRTGVRPDWEDAGNVRGGRWVVARTRESLDSSWREVIMALIGNHWSFGRLFYN